VLQAGEYWSPGFAGVWLGFHLGLFGGRYWYSFGPSGRTLGLERWLRKVGSDRLNATERPLVLLVVDVVSFVIRCCNLVIEKLRKKRKKKKEKVSEQAPS